MYELQIVKHDIALKTVMKWVLLLSGQPRLRLISVQLLFPRLFGHRTASKKDKGLVKRANLPRRGLRRVFPRIDMHEVSHVSAVVDTLRVLDDALKRRAQPVLGPPKQVVRPRP